MRRRAGDRRGKLLQCNCIESISFFQDRSQLRIGLPISEESPVVPSDIVRYDDSGVCGEPSQGKQPWDRAVYV